MRLMFPAAVAAALLVPGIASVAGAQTSRTVLTYAAAAEVRDGCVAWATERGLTISLAVFDDAGRLITTAHLDGTPTAIAEVAQWKGRSAATYRQPSAATATWGGHAPLLADWAGGVPFSATDGTALGAIGVSGASSDDDVACALAGIAAAGLVAPGG
ncbi:GlcG/HbpS family heme-binding protein [Alteriqipengyuania sp. 357]